MYKSASSEFCTGLKARWTPMFNNGRLDNVCQGEDHHRIHPNVIVEFQCLLGIFRLIEVLHFSTTGEWERNKGAGEQR
jgi:hypothetical protein